VNGGHLHDHREACGRNERRLQAVLLLTTLLIGVEVAGGLAAGSLALLADAGHLLTDAAGLVLALLALHFSERPATPQRTYGYYRVEILAALINAVVLTGLSFLILYEAWERLQDPPAIRTGLVIAVATGGLAVNAAGALLLRRAGGESLNMRAAYLEVLADALASLGVIVAALVVRLTGWLQADPLVSALIGLAILPRTWALLKEAVGVLLEGTPSDVNLAALREAIGSVPGVAGVHDLHVWTLTSGVHAMSVHAVLGDEARHQAVLSDVRECVARGFKIAHVTVQIESRGCGDSETHL
jgi:cobalt-zinc-cadmium efflux system protein